MKWQNGEFTITDDANDLQINVIQEFLSKESYWAKGRLLSETKTTLERSACFGMYKGREQVGFARVLTDATTIAYLADVFVLKEFRGAGLGSWLVETVLSSPRFLKVNRWLLQTWDAHELYATHGFEILPLPERWMERVKGAK